MWRTKPNSSNDSTEWHQKGRRQREPRGSVTVAGASRSQGAAKKWVASSVPVLSRSSRCTVSLGGSSMILPIPYDWRAAAGSGQEKWRIPTETPVDLGFLEFLDRSWLKVKGDGHERRGGSNHGLLRPRIKAVAHVE